MFEMRTSCCSTPAQAFAPPKALWGTTPMFAYIHCDECNARWSFIAEKGHLVIYAHCPQCFGNIILAPLSKASFLCTSCHMTWAANGRFHKLSYDDAYAEGFSNV